MSAEAGPPAHVHAPGDGCGGFHDCYQEGRILAGESRWADLEHLMGQQHEQLSIISLSQQNMKDDVHRDMHTVAERINQLVARMDQRAALWTLRYWLPYLGTAIALLAVAVTWWLGTHPTIVHR